MEIATITGLDRIDQFELSRELSDLALNLPPSDSDRHGEPIDPNLFVYAIPAVAFVLTVWLAKARRRERIRLTISTKSSTGAISVVSLDISQSDEKALDPERVRVAEGARVAHVPGNRLRPVAADRAL